MPRTLAVIGIFFLVMGSIPFALLSMIWMAYVGTSLLTPLNWDLGLLLSVARIVVVTALFYFGVFHIGKSLLSVFTNNHLIARKRLLLAALALITACVVVSFFALQDTKGLFPAPVFLSPLLGVPFAFWVRSSK